MQTLAAAGLVAEQLMRRCEGLDPDPDWVAHADRALAWLHVDRGEVDVWEEALAGLLDAHGSA